jgi:hypothetical protein
MEAMMRTLKTALIALIAGTALLELGLAKCSAQEIVQYAKRFKHEEKARRGGGDVYWRDVITMEGYHLHDFAIHIHSIRGGGSGIGKDIAQVWGAIINVNVPTNNRLFEGPVSKGPGVVIADEETVIIRGQTSYDDALKGEGGNVEYTVTAAFVRTDKPEQLTRRFAVVGRQYSADEHVKANAMILSNIRQIPGFDKAPLRNSDDPMFKWDEIEPQGATAIAADGDRLYQISKKGSVWSYTGREKKWEQIEKENATAIAAAGRNLYQISRKGSIWRYSGTPMKWRKLEVRGATAVSARGERAYQIADDGAIWEFVP